MTFEEFKKKKRNILIIFLIFLCDLSAALCVSIYLLFLLYIFIDVEKPVEKINEHLPAQIRVIGELNRSSGLVFKTTVNSSTVTTRLVLTKCGEFFHHVSFLQIDCSSTRRERTPSGPGKSVRSLQVAADQR